MFLVSDFSRCVSRISDTFYYLCHFGKDINRNFSSVLLKMLEDQFIKRIIYIYIHVYIHLYICYSYVVFTENYMCIYVAFTCLLCCPNTVSTWTFAWGIKLNEKIAGGVWEGGSRPGKKNMSKQNTIKKDVLFCCCLFFFVVCFFVSKMFEFSVRWPSFLIILYLRNRTVQ